MNKILLAFTFFALMAIASAFRKNNFSTEQKQVAAPSKTAETFCPNPKFRPEAWMKKFLDGLSGTKSDSDQIKYLQDQIPTDPHVFSSDQVVSTISKLTFDSSRLKSMELLNPYIQSLSSQNIVDILGKLTFSSNKMGALKLIANTLTDISDQSKNLIANQFTFSSDKNEALMILNGISPRNCIYGTITAKVAVFVIDTSGSMDFKFKVNGESISRIQFVKAQLTKTINEQLKKYQKFNIITFSNQATYWKPDVIDATPENILAAITYINKLGTSGATNISGGLDLAFRSKEVLNTIYLLSDGVPNSGVMTIEGIKKYLTDKNQNRQEKVKINTISFILGGPENQQERTLSFEFLNAIADATNGSFKGISE
ncbi:Von willebrand factor type A (vWA) domain was originally protein (macronuclear) [Tetrahymena thermophila SB210]|uniref:von willebrand factor type A (VWA) domain was originally protein n=1 Tax=Tetrahymena thermophila (strain SB210) TaxID=312017 RepID=Q23AF1_TETTS|nr:Von willebrand factor type A (vWA) domain was originally protein [Tetrahymena thermophila SB210]EAR93541.2 Von willebrand factor type A (vWA) domain was originally protein [Tetrahymena thermophila SB210]|eukprot:XP_001013786.2 Von willebrand factor type A (vWA) domain was originally protein [Tetrahymena thermophila SB210]